MVISKEENYVENKSHVIEVGTEKLGNIFQEVSVATSNIVTSSDCPPLCYLKSSENNCVLNSSGNGILLNETAIHFECNNLKGLGSVEIEAAELLPPIEGPISNKLLSNFNELNIRVDSFGPTDSLRRKQLPTYLSLSKEFLNDEPPKYELVTGKQLKTQLKFTPSTLTNDIEHVEGWKKKMIVIVILVVLTVIIVIFFVLGKNLSTRKDSYS
ncbi:uncharacterized protein LOC105845740 isoform X1 [Hydra vulgaris]|uniref:uncharacterized protein LOC105845740 isoform X1 n=1 Tax=Hydra vulgaris TaxID=6087 RepID=UPI001F5E3DF5|nr:uncharacterized protein LOC105845740 [Hydra vulgaris]